MIVARKWTDGSREALRFHCPGCNDEHQVNVSPPGWTWNGSIEKPTITPSVLVQSGHFAPSHDGPCWCSYKERTGEEPDFKCKQCHSFVTDGRIQFLSDCSHALAGQTVNLPEWPVSEGELA